MSSSSTQMVAKECHPSVPASKSSSSRRIMPSFSSSSSLSSSPSYSPDDSPQSLATPFRFSGVPFSWEHLPGIPKKQQNLKNNESKKLLPLPPPTTTRTSKKYGFDDLLTRKKASATGASDGFRKDPFFAALVECSKEDDDQETARNPWTGAKVTRSIGDRFGFINLYTSCKRTCAVSESIIHLPRSTRTVEYGLINRRSR